VHHPVVILRHKCTHIHTYSHLLPRRERERERERENRRGEERRE